jgi:hypothetical protein
MMTSQRLDERLVSPPDRRPADIQRIDLGDLISYCSIDTERCGSYLIRGRGRRRETALSLWVETNRNPGERRVVNPIGEIPKRKRAVVAANINGVPLQRDLQKWSISIAAAKSEAQPAAAVDVR